MKAIVYRKYGGPEVLDYVDLPKPSATAGQVLVKVSYSGMNAADWHLMRGKPYLMRLAFGLFRPKYQRLGCDISGIVESIGAGVEDFRPGDLVFGDVSGPDFVGQCAFSDYIAVNAELLLKAPDHYEARDLAAVPLSAVTAVQALENARLKSGESLCIYGASGGVGHLAVQIAKAMGAEVTAVCSTSKVKMIQTLGADYLMDYQKENIFDTSHRYDVVLAVNGDHTLFDFRKILKPTGRFVMIGGSNRQMFSTMLLAPVLSKISNQKFQFITGKCNKEDLCRVRGFLINGQLRPVIDQEFKLENIRSAMACLEEGHACGKIVIDHQSV